ncbi:MAG TPA: hypothetical protein VJP80_07785 [Candidatus Saccharimonadales bacterium]|nr:hypothetical protein [Candidatus Saccharimonadales bacterium]
MTTATEIPLQTSCIPVANTFGEAPSVEYVSNPLFAEDAAALGGLEEQLRQRHGMETGEAAAAAIQSLGCAACRLEGVCMVQSYLAERVSVGQENAEYKAMLTMFEQSPPWLTAARINRTNMSLDDFETITSTPEQLQSALASGSLSLEQLKADVNNRLGNTYHKADLPELAAIKKIDSQTTIESTEIVTKNGDAFTVVDASEAVGFKEHPLSAAEFGILTEKFLHRIVQPDKTGKPQILSSDGIMQKPIRKVGGQQMFEVRMGGKNRLYFTVTPGKDGQPTRLTILGSHGGDASTQRKFIDVVTA